MRGSTGLGLALTRSAIAIAALVVGASPVYAQSCEPQPGRIVLRVRPPVVDFPAPGLADFDAGYIDSPPFRVQINNRGPRRPWTVCIRSDDASMGGSKNISDLQWQLEGTSAWTPLSLSDQFVAQGNRNVNLRLRFRVLLDFAVDTPGVYQADMTWSA
ncbi:MAG: hypothetical protein ABFS14_08950, partial [Gemmatimonadota bacterium]